MIVCGPDPELVERTVTLMDKIVRNWYNVYGGYRTSSYIGAADEYYISMEYTANWDNSGFIPDWYILKKIFFRKLAKIDRKDEVAVYTQQKA